MKALRIGFDRNLLFKLFLVCAFPIHAWAIIMVIRDLEWIAERTNQWDAIGVFGYALLGALIESLLIFLVIILLSYLISQKWNAEKRFGVLFTVVFVSAFWSIIGQLYFVLGGAAPQFIVDFAISSGHPLWVLYGISFPLVVASIVVPIYLFLQKYQSSGKFMAFVDRLILLSGMYLFLDVIGIIIVIIRNAS